MVNTKMLQQEMRKKGYTLETLAGKIGRSRTGLFNKIHNKSDFRITEINAIIDVLKLKKSEANQIFFATRVE
jgi:hypothetical protein